MTIRQWDRREELRGELLDLIVEMMPWAAPPRGRTHRSSGGWTKS